MIAGLGFGFYFICFKQVGGEAIFWPILISRAITYVVVLIFAFLRRQTLISSPWRTIAGPAALSGLCDSGANATYILASTHGSLAIVAVLASLYPAITVILARFVLNETIVRLQLIGLGVTLVAIVLIAS
jgi:drug/metabolite transporter (DMT)-like permease